MAHIHEKIDYAADVFIVHNGKVLLRMHDKYNIWLAVGGHIELDEDPNEAAVREVWEETGLKVTLWEGNRSPVRSDERATVLIPPVCMNRHRLSETHEHVSLVYFATTTETEIRPQLEEDRSDESRWFTREELDTTDMPQNIREYAHFALDTLHTA